MILAARFRTFARVGQPFDQDAIDAVAVHLGDFEVQIPAIETLAHSRNMAQAA